MLLLKVIIFVGLWIATAMLTDRLAQKIEGIPISNKKNYILGSILIILTSITIKLTSLSIFDISLLAVFLGIEFVAACMDARYKNVYSILHAGALIPLIPLAAIRKPFLGGLLLFCIIQIIMCLFYGASDMLAFDLLGIFYTILLAPERSLEPLLLNAYEECIRLLVPMLIAYIVAFVYQLYKKNVNKFGNCKEACAFIPYIYIANCCGFLLVQFIC